MVDMMVDVVDVVVVGMVVGIVVGVVLAAVLAAVVDVGVVDVMDVDRLLYIRPTHALLVQKSL